MPFSRSALVAVAVLVVAACQTTGSGGSYHFFFSPADHVSQLLAQGEVNKANQVWSQQAAFFVGTTNSEAVKATRSLSQAVSERLSSRLEQEHRRLDAIVWPAPRARWPEVRAGLALAEAAKAELDDLRVLAAAGDARRARFFQAVEAKTAPIRAEAPTHFRAEDPDFFEIYPVSLDRRAVLASSRERWVAALETLSRGDLLTFYGRHRDALDDISMKEVARLHFRAALRGRGGNAEHVFSALDETRLAGLPTARLDRSGVHVVELTDRGGPGAFRVWIEGSPFTVEATDLDRLAQDVAAGAADIMVVIDAREATVERKVASRETEESEFQSGTRERRNPDYERARDKATAARFRVREARRAFERQLDRCRVDCANPALLRHSGLPEAEYDYELALNTLDATPATIPVPTFSAYRFDKVTVDVGKAGSVAYYVIDRRARTLRKGTQAVAARERFAVAEGLHDADRDRMRFAGMHTEVDVLAYAARSETIALMPMFERVAGLAARPLPSMAEIRREIETDRAGARASFNAAIPAAR